MFLKNSAVYRSYRVVVKTVCMPSEKFRYAYSVHFLLDGRTDTAVMVFQWPVGASPEFATHQQAVEEAHACAAAWIDGQYANPQH
jgi:hypothetical protein